MARDHGYGFFGLKLLEIFEHFFGNGARRKKTLVLFAEDGGNLSPLIGAVLDRLSGLLEAGILKRIVSVKFSGAPEVIEKIGEQARAVG
jgi:hypothetical protein